MDELNFLYMIFGRLEQKKATQMNRFFYNYFVL